MSPFFLRECRDFLFGLFARVAVFLLEDAGELVALTTESRQVVIGKLIPLFLDHGRELLPVVGDLIPRHEAASWEINVSAGQGQAEFRYSRRNFPSRIFPLRRMKTMFHEDFTVILTVRAVIKVRSYAPATAGAIACGKRTPIADLVNSLYH